MKKLFFVLIILGIFLFINAGTSHIVFADRGGMVMRPASVRENINIYDAGQKAIIAWNNGVEIMILSTDKYTSQDAKVLEFMPLPSKPTRVEEADTNSFTQVARLIENHRPRIRHKTGERSGHAEPRSSSADAPSVTVVFHQKIGAHDITIAQVNHMNGFTDWVKKFYVSQGMQYRNDDVEKLRPVVMDYLDRGYGYFVFDVIELKRETRSISPILYEFRSKDLFFPLVVTTLSEGETDISLYLFTPGKTDIWGTGTGLASGFYTVDGQVDYRYPIKFTVTPQELLLISSSMSSLMKEAGQVWFSTAVFKGSTKKLTRDFILRVTPEVSSGSFPVR